MYSMRSRNESNTSVNEEKILKISPFVKASTECQNITFQHLALFFLLDCRYLWNIHGEAMNFIHPRVLLLCWVYGP